MIEIRKGKKGEEKKILNVANSVFAPYRHEGFSFESLWSKIYDNNIDYAPMHHLLLEDGEIKSLACNLMKSTSLHDKEYKYSLVGTVSTLPEGRGKGYMRGVMESIDKENRKSNVCFSALSGDRQRYKYYGYEVGPQRLTYTFDKHFLSYANLCNEITFKDYQESENKAYFALYKEYQPVTLRDEADFKVSLIKKYNVVEGIYKDNTLVGYYSINNYGVINELTLKDEKLAASVISRCINYHKFNEVRVDISPLCTKLRLALDEIAVESSLKNHINLKIYNLKEFLEYVIGLNLKNRAIDNLDLVYKVDDKVIEIDIFKNNLSVNYTERDYIKEFTSMEFIRYIFNLLNTDNELFPLYFDILDADLF